MELTPEHLVEHRTKLLEITSFWGWDVSEAGCALCWGCEGGMTLALWRVVNGARGAKEYWVVSEPSGVLPCDFLDSGRARNPREALLKFAEKWDGAANLPLERRLNPDRLQAVLQSNPKALDQDAHLRRMVGIAASLLRDYADSDFPLA